MSETDRRQHRARLQHRARRIELVMAALQDRAMHRHAEAGTTPPPLEHAIADFRVELGSLKRELAQLPRT